MDNHTSRRIDNYRPQSAGTLPQEGLAAVREAVNLASPVSPSAASLLLHAAAQHVGWAASEGIRLSSRQLFAAHLIEPSVAAAAALTSGSVSPFAARLRRLVAAVAGPSSVKTAAIPSSGPQRPYSQAEQTELWVAAAGMGAETSRLYRAGLALGFGCGLTGPAAAAVRPGHLHSVDGHVVVSRAGAAALAVRGVWARRLLASLDGDGPVTDMYDPSGRQRVGSKFALSVGVPKLSPHRMRTTWLVGLLADGVPMGVVADLAGVRPSVIARYLPYLAVPELEQSVERAAEAHRIVAPHPQPFTDLPSLDEVPPGQGRSVDDVVATLRPNDPAVAAEWSGPLGDELRMLVAATADSGDRARNLIVALFRLLEWAVQEPSVPLRVDVLLLESTITRWAALRTRAGKKSSSTAAYLSRMRALRPARTTPIHRREKPGTSIYSDTELIVLETEVAVVDGDRLNPKDWQVLTAVVSTSLGAGAMPQEHRTLTSDRVHEADHGAVVELGVEPTRRLYVPEPHATRLVALAARSDDGPLAIYRSERIAQALERISASLGVTLDLKKLRRTWLVHQLRDGVRADVLAREAGTKLFELDGLTEHLPAHTAAQLTAWSAYVGAEALER